jgi:hypothetical protein
MWNHSNGHNMAELGSAVVPFQVLNLFVEFFEQFGPLLELEDDAKDILIRYNCQLIIQK